MKKYNNVYVDLVGDLFHANHVKLFKEAKMLGTNLLVGVHSDKTVKEYKCTPVLTMGERAEVIKACRYVDKVILDAPAIIDESYIKEHDIDLVLHAHDENEKKYNEMYKNVIKLNKFKDLNTTTVFQQHQ